MVSQAIEVSDLPGKARLATMFNFVHPENKIELASSEILQMQNEIQTYLDSNSWENACRLLAAITVLNPNYRLTLTSSDWNNLKSHLKPYSDWGKYLAYALDLKTIATHQRSQSDMNQTLPPIPETRKF